MRFDILNMQDLQHPHIDNEQLVKSLKPSAKVSSDVSFAIHYFIVYTSVIHFYLILR